MVTLRTHWRAIVGVAAIIGGLTLGILAIAGLTRNEPEPPIASQAGIAADAVLSQRVLLFGDPLIARFDVVLDRGQVNPRSVRIQSNFEPFQTVGDLARTRHDRGDLTQLTFTQRLRCIVQQCLPPISEKLEFTFTDPRVVYRGRSDRGTFDQFVDVSVPPVSIASRLNVREVEESRAANPVLTFENVESGLVAEDVIGLWRESSGALPEPSYRISPTMLTALLLLLAALSAAAAAVLVARQLRFAPAAPTVAAAPPPPTSPLEDALGQLDVALSNGHVDEQRKALELLARELGVSGEESLAGEARQLAWSEDEPARSQARALVENVRATVNGRRPDGDHA